MTLVVQLSDSEVDIEVPCGDFNKRRILGGIFTYLLIQIQKRFQIYKALLIIFCAVWRGWPVC